MGVGRVAEVHIAMSKHAVQGSHCSTAADRKQGTAAAHQLMSGRPVADQHISGQYLKQHGTPQLLDYNTSFWGGKCSVSAHFRCGRQLLRFGPCSTFMYSDPSVGFTAFRAEICPNITAICMFVGFEIVPSYRRFVTLMHSRDRQTNSQLLLRIIF